MALNFPNSPTNGQQFTSGTTTWQWSSTEGVWLIVRPVVVPDAPADGKNYVRNNNVWVELVTSTPSNDLGWVTPEMYGAVGNNSTDDTAAIQAAINTGKSVFFQNKVYKITSALLVQSKFNQRLVGGTISVYGSVHGIILRGSTSCEIDLTMYCANQTGSGFALYIDGQSERCRIRKLHIADNGLNGIYIEQVNLVHIDYFYAINLRGSYGIWWYGNNSKRSDVLNIVHAMIAPLPGNGACYGVRWEGNCHSLTAHNLHTVKCYHGLHCLAASDGSTPQIGRFNMFATDFSYSHGVYIQAGDDFDFQQGYFQGSGGWTGNTGCYGMYCGSSGFSLGHVRVHGGKAIGNSGYGIGCVQDAIYVNGCKMFNNTLGNGSGLYPGSVVI